DNLGHTTSANGTGAFADSEAQALVHSNWLDELNGHVDVIARHDHLDTLRQLHNTGNGGGAEVELWTVVVHEWGVAAALFLLPDVDGALELAVRGVSAWLNSNLAALNLFALGTTQKPTTVVASFGVVHHLAEHLDTGNGGGEGLLLDTDDLEVFVNVQLTALTTTSDNGAATGKVEDVVDRHQE